MQVEPQFSHICEDWFQSDGRPNPKTAGYLGTIDSAEIAKPLAAPLNAKVSGGTFSRVNLLRPQCTAASVSPQKAMCEICGSQNAWERRGTRYATVFLRMPSPATEIAISSPDANVNSFGGTSPVPVSR